MTHTPEGRKKRIETMNKKYGKSTWNKGLTKKTDAKLRKQSDNMKGNHYTPKTEFKKGHITSKEIRKKMSEKWDYKKHFNNNTIKKISESSKNNWKNKDFREKTLRSQRKGLLFKPNNPEKILINIIEKNNLQFDYVGDRRIWFNGEHHSFNPDFLSRNSKHIIEVFGDYWHNLPNIKLRDQERLRAYSKYGYKTLIIWEHELKTPFDILNKIKEFIR